MKKPVKMEVKQNTTKEVHLETVFELEYMASQTDSLDCTTSLPALVVTCIILIDLF